MTTTTLTEDDIRVRKSVTAQLDWDPDVDASAIGVSAKGGVVVLTGFIDSYAGKLAAERATKRVRGVRAVASEIEVRPAHERGDEEIAGDCARALALRQGIPRAVQAVVHHGHVTLTGVVDWLAQRTSAEKAVRHIPGVRGLHNYIEVTPRTIERDAQRRILDALHRDADVEARGLQVHVSGHTVTLAGTVRSWLQREAAERAAASAPGVARVDNQLVVETPPMPEEPEIC
jgi:osmotically-inducible protein OsmY